MKIYVLWAEQGEYSDYKSWIKDIYLDREVAEKIMNELNSDQENIKREYYRIDYSVQEWEVKGG